MHLSGIACLLIVIGLWDAVVVAEFSSLMSPLNDGSTVSEDDSLVLNPINGTSDFRINISRDLNGKPWHDDRKERYITHCVRPATCEKLLNSTCFGSKIPYKSTSLALTDSESQAQSREILYKFEALRNVPKCWAVIQPFLCAIFFPKCERIQGRDMVYLPSLEMCRVTAEPCRILYNTDFFPKFLKCREMNFPCRNCNNDVREMKFNVTGQCLSPLIPTESSMNYYEDIEGCGVQCKDPLYTEEEHESVHKLIFWGILICLMSNVFVVVTFSIHEWKHSKHPAWNLLFICVLFSLSWSGWYWQFVLGVENVVCRRDGTLRHSEPSYGENISCSAQFMIIYFPLIAANVWFAIFTYAWYLQTTDRGSVRDRIDKGSFYFHFTAWALPLFLTIIVMMLNEVGGNSITGICFAGYRNRVTRNWLVLAPVAVLTFGVSVFFTIRGIWNLNGIKKNTSNGEEAKKLNSHILGMGIRTMLVISLVFAFFVFEIFERRNLDLWAESLNNMIVCKIQSSYSYEHTSCKLTDRPSVAMLQLRLCCLFGVNLVISSWCWTWPAIKTWNRFVRRIFGYEMGEEEEFTKPKHRIIADAYAKRMDERYSVSIQDSHTDPAGLNFDMKNLNSTKSNDFVPFTKHLPKVLNRRNAYTDEDLFLPNVRQCSNYDSEFSVSVRQISVESRRSSVDSQVSVKISEAEIMHKVVPLSRKHKNINMKAKKRQRGIYARRRASSSSVESQRITSQIRNTKYKGPNNRIKLNTNGLVERQFERRSACTTVDMQDIQHYQLIHQNNNVIDSISDLTSDDDQYIDDSHKLQIENEPSNMLVPVNIHARNESTESLNFNGKQPSIEQILKKYARGNNGKDLANLLQKSYEMTNATQNGRNSAKSNKNPKYSISRSVQYQQHQMNDIVPSRIEQDSASSVASSIDLEIAVGATHSSFSDHGAERTTTQSQNSKGSCDVGVQADAYDIVSHSRQRSHDDCAKDNVPEKVSYDDDNDATEFHKLLSVRERNLPLIIRKEMNGKHLNMSESEKLDWLLLP